MAVFSIMALALFGLVFLIAVAVVVALLANQRTRPIGIVFAVLGGGVCCLVAIAMVFFGVSRTGMEQHWEVAAAVEARQQAEAQISAVEEAWGQSPIQVEEPSPADGSPLDAPTQEPPPPEPPENELTPGESDVDDAADASTESEPGDATGDDEATEPHDTAETPGETEAEATAPPPPEPNTGDESADDSTTVAPQDPAGTDVGPATVPDPSAVGGARPAMVAKPPKSWVNIETGYKNGVYRTVVRTDPLQTPQECHEALPKKLEEAVETFARTQLGFALRLRSEDIQSQLVKDYWEETVEITELGTWVRLHALVEIDQSTIAVMRRQHEESQQELVVVERIVLAVVGLAVVLAMLTVLFVCLRMDQKTEGKYRGRMSIAAVVVVLLVFVAATNFLDFVHWIYIRPAQQIMEANGVEDDDMGHPPTYSIEGQQDRLHTQPHVPSSGLTIIETPYPSYPATSSDGPIAARTPSEHSGIRHVTVHSSRAKLAIGTPIALIFLGGIIALVINRKTRVAGAVVLAVGIAILVVVSA